MRHLSRLGLGWLALSLCAAGVQAAGAVLPTHYDMPNGYGVANGGSYNYRDKAYSGSGDSSQDYALLSGGLGDLSDGVIATQRWDLVENLEGSGPYVGWNRAEPWLISFHFAQDLVFDTITIWYDDADGYGDISPPASFSVTVNGVTQAFAVVDPPGDAPSFSVLQLAPGLVGASLVLGVERFNNGLMLSEVQFTATPVPEPAAWMLMGAGLALGGLLRRRLGVAA
ncbi:MAG: PEP-CTERM sorting domain-containing protein [Inhella sp.]